MFDLFAKKDSQIQKDVMKELKWDPLITPSDIDVSAKDGIVTLRGSVPHYFEKIMAEEAAQRVGGVRAVADEIEVNLLADYERRDEDIARAALSALEWNYQVPKGVKLSVAKGWVTLAGDFEWNYEKSAAQTTVSQLMGVRGVTNNISIHSSLHPSDVKSCIEEAFKRSATNEVHKINVTVDGSRVTLSGTVDSFSEVENARLAAWKAPGVTTVTTNIKLSH